MQTRQPMLDHEHHLHLMNERAGHAHSLNCWCEPTYFWMRDNSGDWMLVVEHVDTTDTPHPDVIRNREISPDWVTSTLETLFTKGD